MVVVGEQVEGHALGACVWDTESNGRRKGAVAVVG